MRIRKKDLVLLSCLGGQQQLLTRGLWKDLLSSALESVGAESSSLAGHPPPVLCIVPARLRKGLTEATGQYSVYGGADWEVRVEGSSWIPRM